VRVSVSNTGMLEGVGIFEALPPSAPSGGDAALKSLWRAATASKEWAK
jgi:hypothetical protein